MEKPLSLLLWRDVIAGGGTGGTGGCTLRPPARTAGSVPDGRIDFDWRAVGVDKTLLALFVGVPVLLPPLLLLALLLMLLAELLPVPGIPPDGSSILAGVTGGREGGGLHGGTACVSGVRPLLAPWLGDPKVSSIIISVYARGNHPEL